MKAWPVLGILFIQGILLLAHWFIYRTWIDFLHPLGTAATVLRLAVIPLAVSFMVAALLGFRFSNFAIRALYWLASVWLGAVNYLFLAAVLCWAVDLSARVCGLVVERTWIAGCLFGLAAAVSVAGYLNAQWIRLRRVTVALPGLPESWKGRRAVMVSDLHLGNLNGIGFCRRIAARIEALKPDAVFIPGDFFDGSGADPDMLAAPFRELKPPLGIYYVTGNHEEFTDGSRYTRAIAGAGIRVLANEKATIDGVQVLGIPYSDSTFPMRVKATLDALAPSAAGQPSILLLHAPTRLPIVEQAGVALQLSGHTHKGQMFPFSWLTRRVFGKFTHGLQRFGSLLVYTSSGVGTWGPPMRVGTSPEIVVMTFERS